MFVCKKSKNLTMRTISDVESMKNDLNRLGYYYPNGVSDEMVECLYIALDDCFAFLENNSDIGDQIIDFYINKIRNFGSLKQMYRGLIVDLHKEYYRFIQEAFNQNKTSKAVAEGYEQINRFIAEKLNLDFSDHQVKQILTHYFIQRVEDIIHTVR